MQKFFILKVKNIKYKKLTEFTAKMYSFPVAASFLFAVTIQAPQPPSKHMNFVPFRCAIVRINSFKEVSTEREEETVERNHYM